MKKGLLLSVGLVLLTLTITSKVVYGQTAELPLVAKQLSAAPTIDGTIDAVWSGLSYDDVKNKLVNTAFDDADFSGKIKAGWKGNFIYVLVDITDNVIVANAAWAHKQDNCVLYVDLIDDQVAKYQDLNSFYRSINADASATGGRYDGLWEAPAEGINVAVGLKTGGWIAEWSIDVTKFDMTGLKVGDVIGLNVEIGDNDDKLVDQRVSQFVWSPTSTGKDWSSPVGQVGFVTLAGGTVSAKESINNYELRVYPNPTSGTIRLNSDASSVEIYSINGAKVKTFTNVLANKSLSIENLQGLYLVKITDNNGSVYNQKLIVN